MANFFKRFLNKKDRKQEDIADFHTTIIRVEDNFVSTSSIILDEPLMGNIYSLKEVIVAEKAQVKGNVISRVSSVSGRVDGDIISTEYAEIKDTAVIRGNIRAKAISIAGGAVINGSIRIEGGIDEHDLLEKVEKRLPARIIEKRPEFMNPAPPEKLFPETEPPGKNGQPAEAARKDIPEGHEGHSRSRGGEERVSGNSWY